MNILVIASLLPVPGIIKETVYVLRLTEFYKQKYPDSKFLFIRPVSSGKYLPVIYKTQNQLNRDAAIKQGDFKIDDNEIQVWPYYSLGRNSFLHSYLSRSIFLQIKRRKDSIRKFNPDIIHAHFLFPDGFLAKKLSVILGIPYIITMQDESRFIKSSWTFKQVSCILNKASILTTLSPKMLSILEGKGYENICLLLPGIDKSFFNQKKPARKDKTIRFVTAANLIKRKNVKSVIEAIALIGNNFDISYTVIGDGPEKGKLKKLTEFLGLAEKVRFLPSIPNEELASVLVNYDVFIQPSFVDSFGLSYFEALACGLPVILTRNSGAYYIIKDLNSYLTVDPYDIGDIAKKMLAYTKIEKIETQYQDCKLAGRLANWDTTISNLHSFYNEIISKSNE